MITAALQSCCAVNSELHLFILFGHLFEEDNKIPDISFGYRGGV